MALADVSYGEDVPQVVNLITEIQKGQQNKYEFDKETGTLALDRVNGVAMAYPADYGFIPDTLCEDGDPLDGLLVIDETVPPGIVVPVRPVGVLYMVDDGEDDEKLVCVADKDITKDHVQEVGDLGPNFTKIVEHFYTHYKDWKKDWQGVEVAFNGWGGAQEAQQVVKDAIARADK